MKPRELLLRCYANKYDDQWQAFCIDFGLAAQGDSYEEVKAKLSDMIREYLYDALVGEDKEYAEQLLQRKRLSSKSRHITGILCCIIWVFSEMSFISCSSSLRL